MDKKKQSVKLKLVVSGFPYELRAKRSHSIAVLMTEALKMTGNIGQPVENWELRDMGGRLIDRGISVKDAAIVDNQTLFLNLQAGVGGAIAA